MIIVQFLILGFITAAFVASAVMTFMPFTKKEPVVYGCSALRDVKPEDRVVELPWTEHMLMCPPRNEATLTAKTRCDAVVTVRGRFVNESSQESSRNLCTLHNDLLPGTVFNSVCGGLHMERSRDGQDILFKVDSRDGWRGGILVTQTLPSAEL